jgi:Na+/melibiose symporter-like transporter
MTEENGTKHIELKTKPPEQPPSQAHVQMQLAPQGVMLTFPVNLMLDNAMMAQFVKLYLSQHPELVQEIAREAVKQKQQEQKFLQLVKQSRND